MDLSRVSSVPGAAWRAAKAFVGAHKFWSAVIALVVLYGGYRVYAAVTAPSTATRYVTTTVATGTVVATLTETGQVSASQQLSLAPQASGQVVGVYVKTGDRVQAGQVIAQLDATNAEQSLQNAELALKNAELSYQQTTATSTLALNLIQAQNGVANAQISLQKTHDTSYASLSAIYTDMSNIINDLNADLHDSNVPGRSSQQNLFAYTDMMSSYDSTITVTSNTTQNAYTAAVTAYNTALAEYNATNLLITDQDLTTLAGQTYTAAMTIAEAVKDAHNFFDQVNTDYSLYNLKADSELSVLLSNVNADATTINTDASTALTVKSNIISAEQTLAQAQNTLTQTEGGSNALTVQSAKLSLQQAQQAVTTAEQNLADYTVTAPFAGTIASVGVQKYDQASSGTTVATLVTSNQNVVLSVNEVDAASIKPGQKATLTFDALPNVTIAGTVATVNTVGSVSSGVVSYQGTVAFDTQNTSVLPGMSATANIITGDQTGLVVPASAIKAGGGRSYVQVFNPPLAGSENASGATSPTLPQDVFITTGLTDNTNTIVESGLSAGDQIVTQTITGSAAAALSGAAQSTSAFGGARTGGGAPGGGAVFRALGR
ncbi:MAG TPA: efflux RND transporter periplasmic adaptor subunit [Candidatus Paceibacterota bacterium]|nr:efflux RND transporter periplasmic adaptor subunit [Candidatus Paceibacterota bacterium]